MTGVPSSTCAHTYLAVCVLAMKITQLTHGGPKMENRPIFQSDKLFNWMVHTLLRFSQQIPSIYPGHIRALTKNTKAVDYHTFNFSHRPKALSLLRAHKYLSIARSSLLYWRLATTGTSAKPWSIFIHYLPHSHSLAHKQNMPR